MKKAESCSAAWEYKQDGSWKRMVFWISIIYI